MTTHWSTRRNIRPTDTTAADVAAQVAAAGDTMSGTLAIVQGVASTIALSTKVTGDAANRFQVLEDGTLSWGGGSGAVDVSLSRSAADVLTLAASDRFNADYLAVNRTGAFGTVGRFGVNTPTTVDNTVNTTLASSAATAIPLMLQMAPAQSAYAVQIQTSAGSGVWRVSDSGSSIQSGNVNAGAGIFTSYLQSGGTTAASGQIRLPNNTTVRARNAGNDGDIDLIQATSSDVVQLGGSGTAMATVLLGATEAARFLAAGLKVKSTGAFGTVEAFRVNTPTTADNVVNTLLSAAATGDYALGLQQAPSSTGVPLIARSSAGGNYFWGDLSGYWNGAGCRDTASANNARVATASNGTEVRRNVADSNTCLDVNQAHASSTGPIATFRNSGGVVHTITQGGLNKWVAANTQTTVGAAGAASALPATPTRYLKVVDSDGTELVIPAYLAA